MDGCPDFTIRDTNRLGRILDYYFLDRATTPLWQLGQHIPVMAQQPIIFRISSEIASGIHIVGADLFVRGVLTMRHSRRSGFALFFSCGSVLSGQPVSYFLSDLVIQTLFKVARHNRTFSASAKSVVWLWRCLYDLSLKWKVTWKVNTVWI